MIPSNTLDGALSLLVASRWLGLSPHPGDFFTFKTLVPRALSFLLVLSAGVWFWKSSFFLQVIACAAALLFTILRNVFYTKDFAELLQTYNELDVLPGWFNYGFRWSFLFSVAELAVKGAVLYIEDAGLQDVLILLHVLKQEEILVLIHVLSCQCDVLNRGDLPEYRLFCTALYSLRCYLSAEVPLSCFLCFLWISNSSFLGVKSLMKIVLSSTTHRLSVLHCLFYWASCLFTLMSLVIMVTCYNRIEEEKEEFEEQLYWSMLSDASQRTTVSAKYLMLFEVCSREDAKEDLQINNRMIYSVMSAAVTFLVILLQFGFEDIYCNANKEQMK